MYSGSFYSRLSVLEMCRQATENLNKYIGDRKQTVITEAVEESRSSRWLGIFKRKPLTPQQAAEKNSLDLSIVEEVGAQKCKSIDTLYTMAWFSAEEKVFLSAEDFAFLKNWAA